MYASGQEIVQFYQQLAWDYGVYEHIKFKHQVVDARWDDKAALWKLTVLNLETGETFVDSAEVFVNSGGVLKYVKKDTSPFI